MNIYSKEFYDLMAAFEKTERFKPIRDVKCHWPVGGYYVHLEANNRFKGFLSGYQYAKSLTRIEALPLED